MIEENNPQKSESETVQSIEIKIEAEKVTVKPKLGRRSKTKRVQWDLARRDFEAGNYTSIVELAEKYSVHPTTFFRRMTNENWREKKAIVMNKIEARFEEKVLKKISDADLYLQNSFLRAKSYEKIIDASKENLGSKTADGTPLLDPEAIEAYTRSEQRIHELAKSALRISDRQEVDVKSGGLSLGENLILAIERLRGDASTPKLTEEDAKRVLELEVADEETL